MSVYVGSSSVLGFSKLFHSVVLTQPVMYVGRRCLLILTFRLVQVEMTGAHRN